jgi:hypothetical protein
VGSTLALAQPHYYDRLVQLASTIFGTTICARAWNASLGQGDIWNRVGQKLSTCKSDLLRWKRETWGKSRQTIKSLQHRLNGAYDSFDTQAGSDLKNIKQELESLLAQDDERWKQRAKVNWLKNGDRNTKFYYACANQRRSGNRISKIADEAGLVWESQNDIQTAFMKYFSRLFTAGPMGDLEVCLQNLNRRVSDEMNGELLRTFTEEIGFALKQMAPLKASGPDGLPADFFQKHWDLMGDEVCLAVLNTLNSGILPHYLNMTHIALIPKVKNPSNVTEFRPISLCNVLYKLISKVLANRLKKILPHIISQTQSAFIPGRLISDNILAAYETLHTMHSRMKGKKGFMAVKLDMSKAYDMVEWKFLEKVMRRMGFAPRWIHLIMMCVTTVKYAVVVNGNPSGCILPTRGLRQGDPISPYIFLICAEVLSSMVTVANREGSLTGVQTSKLGPRVSHLFFADDSLLFCRSSLTQWNYLTQLLQRYEAASGQRLNGNKTAIFFSKITSHEQKKEIVEVAGIPVNQRYDTYFGLPALVGK